MFVPPHRNPSSLNAPHLAVISNPRLSPITNPKLSPITNPALSAITNPKLSPITNPRLSPITNAALSKITNPALSAFTNPRLSPFQNPLANPNASDGLDGFYLFDSGNQVEGYALFATDVLAIVHDRNGKELGLAVHEDRDYWLFLPPHGGSPVEQWWIVQPDVFVRFRQQRIVGLVT
jgi:hypothetical protein